MNIVASNQNKKVFFPNLDGLRTIAFLLVYLQHGFWASFKHLNVESDFLNRIVYGVGSGGTGVSIFFVLSGFLITYLLLTEEKVKGKIHLWHFYIRRVLRIWPLFFAVIIFAFIIYPTLKSFLGVESNLASRPIYYFTFLSNFDVINIQKFHPGADAMIESITWSVSIEEQFYLVWPLLFLFTPKRYYRLIFLSIIALCLIFRYYNRGDSSVIYFHTLSVCADLAIGGICAYYCLYSKSFIKFFKRISKAGIIGIYLSGFLWMLYGGALLNQHTGPIFFRLTNTLFFAFVILEQNFTEKSLFKFSHSKVLSFWGKYTYGLYLLHPMAILIIDVSLRIINIPYKESFLPLFAAGIAGLVLSLLMSYLSYEYFELRFLKLKERFSFVHKQTRASKTDMVKENDALINRQAPLSS